MPKPLDVKTIPIEHPARDAWRKYKVSEGPDTAKDAFMAGWNAALAWILDPIAQFPEIDEKQQAEIESLKKEIEDLKRDNPPIDSGSNSA